ncbi:helix-turn-helix domain-containing protein [Sphingomonas vulcanisoli]|uniref:helix-turn-helix domain-containing protein n=1 Tax=Sphingomonas vulcanisoli TaxID=1658060 RepID=UPI001420FCE4|nr:helix-turn-helix transcriptional regulator [Sphingomonas vulcanisoli]
MEDWQKRFGARVRALRKERGLTQERLAVDAEIDLTYLGGIERGRRNPTLSVIVRIAEALQVSPSAIFDYDPTTDAEV